MTSNEGEPSHRSTNHPHVLKDRNVTVMGLGRFGGGIGAARWLAEQGAHVTVTDTASADQLSESVAQLADLPIRHVLGGHDERDFRDADLVVVSPAVPDRAPLLATARANDVPVTTEINLFLERCPCRVVGITGSVGKSTITAMTGQILKTALGEDGVWVGGNIGASLLGDLPRMASDHVVVLELSSFQLARTPAIRWSPTIAVITNVTPNHLDWHGGFADYLASKLNIVRYQDPQRDTIIMEDVPTLRTNFDLLFGDLAGIWRYDLDSRDEPQAVMQTTSAVDCDNRQLSWPELRLSVPGAHNRRNAAAALTVAHALGIDGPRATEPLATFRALPDRLEFVAEHANVAYYNDSKSSTPESAITAMRAIERPLLIILGGYDKQVDLSAAVQFAATRAKHVACIGETGPRIQAAVEAAGGTATLDKDMGSAVNSCARRAVAGDAVLLSPACASWDQFADYRARGRCFRDLVHQLAGKAQ